LNATSVAKPKKLQKLHADLVANNIDIAVISETWFKMRHTDKILTLAGYNLFRRDRKRRRGGGVAIYVADSVKSDIYSPPGDDPKFEVLWVKTCVTAVPCYIAALYHPPTSSKVGYTVDNLLDYLSCAIDNIVRTNNNLAPIIILAGDFNQLRDTSLQAMGLINAVNVPTHKGHCLDRVYTNEPLYLAAKVVQSTVPTAHKAVIVRADSRFIADINKKSTTLIFRNRTPDRHAALLDSLGNVDWTTVLYDQFHTQAAFNTLYSLLKTMLETHYPESKITVTTRDPPYMTPTIKSMLRQKNRLMRKGHIEHAGALATRIGVAMDQFNSQRLALIDRKSGQKLMWSKVREITGKGRTDKMCDIDPATMNAHYAAVSHDAHYVAPVSKSTCSVAKQEWPSEYSVLRALLALKPTATGLDGLPAWFLKVAAPLIAEPLAWLYRLSLSESVVPEQWKSACISPVPKVPQPAAPSDYRPISITAVLSRVLERIIVRQAFYSLLYSKVPDVVSALSDQYAFRPTGSTTAALISILQDLSDMSHTYPYVHLIALDFSKAFDTVRHSTLLAKFDKFHLEDNIYNWLVDYFAGRKHCTKVNGVISLPLSINASIIQGSSIGPVSYITNASDLKAKTPGNKLHKYADDTYLLVPSVNSGAILIEMEHISTWATDNNLRLNGKKCLEMVVVRPRMRSRPSLPSPIPDLNRVESLSILGVTVKSNLSISEHINNLLASTSQTLYALNTLKSHGMSLFALTDICRATLLSKLTYAAPAWRGFATTAEIARLQSVLVKASRWGVWGERSLLLIDVIDAAESKLFTKVLCNTAHVLYPLVPPKKETGHDTRPRGHDRQLTQVTAGSQRNFISRLIFKDMY
jgi:hypothetical protein